MSYRQHDLKILWGKAGGRCSFPDCNNEIIFEAHEDVVGEMAHIIAKKEAGPRGNPDFPKPELDAYDNLILLCTYHHSLIDSAESSYSVDDLRAMKSVHEEQVQRALSRGAPWDINVSQLYYVNVPRLSILAAMHGFDLDISFLRNIECLHSLGIELIGLLVQFEDLLHKLDLVALPLVDLSLSEPNEVGVIASFDDQFRTRNVPGLDTFQNEGFQLTGNLDHDPYIYKNHLGVKLILAIDPRWITTATSFVNFRPSGGWGSYAGLFSIKDIDPQSDIALGTPIVIGIPRSPLNELLFQ